MNLSKQKNKIIGIFGLGITGISVYKNLVNVAKSIICYDDSKINKEAFSVEFGNQSLFSIEDKRWAGLDAIVISPGIPHSHRIFKIASANGITITSDIELFIEENHDSEFIFITGTNGKSTVTALTGHILRQAGLDYYIGGNIGTPVMSLPSDRKGYIFELSSFQIELLNKIDPKISVITNITPDHLDRHGTIQAYTEIKEKILTSDALKIIGVNSDILQNIYNKFKKHCNSKIVAISTREKVKDSIFYDDEYLEDSFFNQKKYFLPDLNHLQGLHNKENIAIAYAICRALSVPSSLIIKALETFEGPSHRMQYVGHYKNINFYNDSKATNISSALSSLSSFNNIIWFAGGKFKENSLEEFELILHNIEKAYFFGESKNLFAKYLESNLTHKIKYEVCDDLEEAFSKAIEYSTKIRNKKLNFLLAPACASYDQFKNFEERGKLFMKLASSV
ncbi:MAG: UDP-N-acetylmuramoyl-L-alanine--D-glutamate ligase [Rickettsiaceae bacterium]